MKTIKKLRTAPLTKENAKRIGQSYRYMYLLSRLMDLEYTNYRDINLKSPVLHQKITRMTQDLEAVTKHHSLVLDTADADDILDSVYYLNNVVKVLCGLEPHQIKEFSEGLANMLKQEEVA